MNYRIVSLIAVFCILLAAGCSSSKSDPTADTSVTTEEKTTETETTNPPVDMTALFKEIAGSFKANDGNKGFTILKISEDGGFNGQFDYMEHKHDENLGGYFEDKQAKFSGTFQAAQRIDDYIISLSVSNLDYQTSVATEKTIDNHKALYTISPHIKSNNQFYLYIPGTPIKRIPDDGLNFLNNTTPPWNYSDDSEETNTYILYNRNNGTVFYRILENTEQTETTVSSSFEVAPASEDDILHSGLWIDYSVQAPDGIIYEFRNNGVIVNRLDFANKTVTMNAGSDYPQTLDYHVENGKVYITLKNGESKILYPTDKETQMEYSYENGLDPGTFITQRVYHHDNLPTYEALVTESVESRNASKVN